MRLEGRTALVTGGASGIGAATALRLAAEGARVAVGDVDLEGARAVVAEIDGVAAALDVTDTASVRRAVLTVTEALGPVDVLVNNVGIDRFGWFVDNGVIVSVASEAGRVGSQGSATYSAAKAGVIGFTKAIARESARFGVRCNAVAPGPIETPLLNSAPEQLGALGERLKQGMIAATAMRRIGEPEQVAAAIAFLASDDASYVTGQTLNVSGGLSMW
ncbi:MAG: 2-hydroxycyclohexanecarboxyl-CoA dehydrogenase [bacterium]